MTECPRCGADKHRGRCKRAVVVEEGVPTPTPTVVTITPSMGARLKIAGHLLEIEQDRPGEDGELYTHTISLYPHEAGQVIDAISRFVDPVKGV